MDIICLMKSKKNKIKRILERIDKYINKIYNKNKNKIYFHCFFLIAYNLYRFLIMKEKRNKIKIDNQQENGKTCCLKSLLKNSKLENQFRVNVYIYFKLVNIILIRFIN